MELKWFLCVSQCFFTLTYTRTSRNEISTCDAAVKVLYSWCEQSMCVRGCKCKQDTKICKQICLSKSCSSLKCVSNKSCRQSTLVKTNQIPTVRSMVASSVDVQQDCSQAICHLLFARRFRNMQSKVLQVCPEGKCTRMISHADETEQLAGRADLMRCSGSHANKCTQVCVLGKCKSMICKAKYCRQRCSHNSECQMTCGRNTEFCDQVCSYGSRCNMRCSAKRCNQTCTGEKKDCVVFRSISRKPNKTFQIERVDIVDSKVKFVNSTLLVNKKKGMNTVYLGRNDTVKEINSTINYFGYDSSPNRKDVNTTERNYSSSQAKHPFRNISSILIILFTLHVVMTCT